MQLQIDWKSRAVWARIGGLFGLLIPLIVFLSGDELLLTLAAAAMGYALGQALWLAAWKDRRGG